MPRSIAVVTQSREWSAALDDVRFDRFIRAVSRAGSRRQALASVLLGMPGLLLRSHDPASAKKKACPPCRKRKKGKCRGVVPDGTPCPGGTCRSGQCLAAASPPPLPPTSPPIAGCLNGQKPCAGRCIPREQCCDNADCTISGEVCTGGRCACPAALPDVCGGACLARCSSAAFLVRNTQTCGCCIRPGAPTTNPGECCLGFGFPTCSGIATGDACAFSGQCLSNNCLCGAFGCSCQ